MIGLMIMNHDDYRYFFGVTRSQPWAIIPWKGPPAIIAFAAEEPQLISELRNEKVRVFTHVGEQINQVASYFRTLAQESDIGFNGGKPRVGMTLTIGHTILAIPGVGGVRHEDVYLVTPTGGKVLFDYPVDPIIRA